MFRRVNKIMPCIESVMIDSKAAANNSAVCAIDDIPQLGFTKNSAGWRKNVFACALQAQTEEQYIAIMSSINSQVVDLSQDKGINDKLSMDEIVALHRPRYCQSYTEMQQFGDYVNSLDFIQKLDKETVDKITAESDPDNVEKQTFDSSENAE